MQPTESEDDLPREVIVRNSTPQAGRSLRIGRYFVALLSVMALLMTGAIVGMIFQPPGLRLFLAVTGLEPGSGTSEPIALPPDVAVPEELAATMQPTDVIGLARLMPRGDVSIVAPPFGAGDARVREIYVGIGDTVEKGDVVALLDNVDALESAVSAAEAGLAVSEATLVQTRQDVRNSLAEAQASLEQAEAAAQAADQELERTRSLRERGVASEATLDQVLSEARQADRAVAAARARLARFQSEELNAQPDVIVAERNVDAARAELERARRDLSRARVIAPLSGTVLDIMVQPGERPGSEGMMKIGDIQQMMAEVEIYQSQVAHVEVGQPVEIAADALDRTLYGTVTRIGLVVGRQSVIEDDPAASTDARVVKVLVRLDAESSRVASRFTDLEVIARVDTRTPP